MDIRAFLQLLRDVRGPAGNGNYIARCPAHDDSTASLSVAEGEKGIVIKCWAGCRAEDVMAALGLKVKDLFYDSGSDKRPPAKTAPKEKKTFGSYDAAYGYLGQFERAYTYRDESGAPLFEVARIKTADGKTFRQHLLTGPGFTFPLVKGVPDKLKNALYNLPQVKAAIAQGELVYVVEGEKDADNMTALGYTATTQAMGAGKWRTAHSEHLRGADVCVCPDNDEPGHDHAEKVAASLAGVASSVRVINLLDGCPELPDKGDITDFFKALGKSKGMEKLAALVDGATVRQDEPETERDRAAKYYDQVGGYCVDDGCICQKTDEGPRRLGTFVALPRWIIERDDGVNIEKLFLIDGWSRAGQQLPQARVPATKFASMGWVLENWDFAANIMPRTTAKAHLLYAITEVGEMAAKRETVYAHTGWRKVEGKWVYMHKGGAVGCEGISVDLGSALSNYTLDGYDDEPLGDLAIAAYTQMRICMAAHVAVPLLGITYLAPLREFLQQAGYAPGFAMFLLGGTGLRKSTAAALALSHFGNFNSKNLPASFNDTSNTIRKKAFQLKDNLIVVDDYCPQSSIQERRRMEATAQSLSRAFGDGADRGRMRADLSLQEAMPPRGMAIISGEDTPNIGESGTARYYIVSIGKNDVPADEQLTEAQAMARSGKLRRVMRGFIEWLLPMADKLPDKLASAFLALRAEAIRRGGDQHGRAPEAVAHVMLGYEMMLEYLMSLGVIDKEVADTEFDMAWQTILESSKQQSREAMEERPTRMFLASLGEMLVNKSAAVKDLTNYESAEPSKGMVGYMDGSYYYLLPEVSYAAVFKMYTEQGLAFPLTKRMLFKQLRDDGMVEADADGKTTKPKQIAGKMMRLLWVPRRFIEGPPPPKVEQMRMDSVDENGDELPF